MAASQIRLQQGAALLWHETLGSTNDEAKRLAAQGETGPLWIAAGRQTQGRGRQGRDWQSLAGNLAATYLFAPALPPAEAARLSFAAALAVADLIDVYLPGTARLKWPNDVLVRGRKIAGILLESAGGEAGSVRWLAIGIGVNLKSHPDGTIFPATSVAAECGAGPDPREALEHLAKALDHWLARHAHGGFAPIREAWLTRGPERGAALSLRQGEETILGQFEDLSGDGALILRDTQGGLRVVTAGEVFPHE